MFSSSPNYSKLKTHLRLAVNRLKLLEKKKTELALKSRKEIADYLGTGKIERAKIRVEQIIREDYLVEAMEIVELFCDTLLARFGLLTQMKELDEGIAECVSSLIWVAPRLQSDVSELKIISDVLTAKYGKLYAEVARTATGDHKVNGKLMHKLAVQAPPKLLVEKYLIEIAKIYNIDYEPDPQVIKDEDDEIGRDGQLIDLQDRNNLGGGGGGGGAAQPIGFIDFPQPPALPVYPPMQPNASYNYPHPGNSGGTFNYPQPGNSGGSTFNYPQPGSSAAAKAAEAAGSGSSTFSATAPFNYNIPPYPQNEPEKKDLNTNFLAEETNNFPPPYSSLNNPDENAMFRPQPKARPPTYSAATNNNIVAQNLNTPKPQPRSKLPPSNSNEDFLNLPSVPSDLPDVPSGGCSNTSPPGKNDNEDIDFDDLSRRFEELKKNKP